MLFVCYRFFFIQFYFSLDFLCGQHNRVRIGKSYSQRESNSSMFLCRSFQCKQQSDSIKFDCVRSICHNVNKMFICLLTPKLCSIVGALFGDIATVTWEAANLQLNSIKKLNNSIISRSNGHHRVVLSFVRRLSFSFQFRSASESKRIKR